MSENKINCNVCQELVTDWRRFDAVYHFKESGGIDWEKTTGLYLCNECAGDVLDLALGYLTKEEKIKILFKLAIAGEEDFDE